MGTDGQDGNRKKDDRRRKNGKRRRRNMKGVGFMKEDRADERKGTKTRGKRGPFRKEKKKKE